MAKTTRTPVPGPTVANLSAAVHAQPAFEGAPLALIERARLLFQEVYGLQHSSGLVPTLPLLDGIRELRLVLRQIAREAGIPVSGKD